MPGGPLTPTGPQNFSGLFLKVLHRPLTAPLVAKLAPPVAPQMKLSGSTPAWIQLFNPKKEVVQTAAV